MDDARIAAADAEPGSWLAHGRTWSEQRYSPLDQIDEHNVARLGLAWSHDLGTHRGLEATPLVADGILTVTGVWSRVHAFDARTGEPLWTHDPRVPRDIARVICCDVVNRGVARYGDRVYSATLDGRLEALDARSGRLVWSVRTTPEGEPYTITGAPRVLEGLVLIGSSGADLGARGYVAAYDAETGALAWRTWTVPGDPAQGFESAALERAAETWKGRWWEPGGGGTVWDSMAYDPQLGLVYVGTGNGGPWSRSLRSPGGGDNLYLSSILALRASTGELVWHYQTTPGDAWDYTATQHMVLADLEIGGATRAVLMQAPKNGFFYVLDRANGELLSAEPYARVTWATRVDLASGRPVEAPGIRDTDHPVTIYPSSAGAHNWQPMAFHPGTGLVYIPTQEMPGVFTVDPDFERAERGHNTGLDMAMYRALPPPGASSGVASGALVAWDPVRARERWRVPQATANNGGVLATAGGLVFQGTADGRFAAYRASDGDRLFEMEVGTGIVAPPISYAVDGVQYVAILAGWGGSFALAAGDAAAAAGVRSAGRLLVFALDATGALPKVPPPPVPRVADVQIELPAGDLALGSDRYHQWCAVCHGVGAVGGGVLPDLRFVPREVHQAFDDVVLGGSRASLGMPAFDDVLDATDVRRIQGYILSRARLTPGVLGPAAR